MYLFTIDMAIEYVSLYYQIENSSKCYYKTYLTMKKLASIHLNINNTRRTMYNYIIIF